MLSSELVELEKLENNSAVEEIAVCKAVEIEPAAWAIDNIVVDKSTKTLDSSCNSVINEFDREVSITESGANMDDCDVNTFADNDWRACKT